MEELKNCYLKSKRETLIVSAWKDCLYALRSLPALRGRVHGGLDFTKGGKTERIWFYNMEKNVLGKGSRIAAEDRVLSIIVWGSSRDAFSTRLKARAATRSLKNREKAG